LPSVTKEPGPVFGLPELGPTLLLAGLFLFCYALFARRFPMISPRLAEITLGRELHHLEASPEYDHEEKASDFAHPKELEGYGRLGARWLRSLPRAPGYFLPAVLSLGIALGAGAAAFSVIDAVRFRALPFKDGERLVLLSEVPINQPAAATAGCRSTCE